MALISKSKARRLIIAANRAQVVNDLIATKTGNVYTVSNYGLTLPVAFAKISGNVNLTINSSSGVISASSPVTNTQTQTIACTITGNDGFILPVTLNLTGKG